MIDLGSLQQERITEDEVELGTRTTRAPFGRVSLREDGFELPASDEPAQRLGDRHRPRVTKSLPV